MAHKMFSLTAQQPVVESGPPPAPPLVNYLNRLLSSGIGRSSSSSTKSRGCRPVLFLFVLSAAFAITIVTDNCFICCQAFSIDKMVDKLLFHYIPILQGAPAADENGTMEEFKMFAFEEKSNDAVARATTQELIARAGFAYENHYALSDDGYITQLIRIVNPLADPKKLKQPPIIMMHGGIISSTVYVFASNIQHHPERYPRGPDDLAMTSYNRSLGLMLSNNGYDVWLVGTRGSNRQNQAHLKYGVYNPESVFRNHDQDLKKNRQRKKTNRYRDLVESFGYWDYTMDDLIAYELPRQIDRVLELTGAQNVSLMSFSYSTMIALPLLAENTTYAAKVHSHICMGPILTRQGSNLFLRLLIDRCNTRTYLEGVLSLNNYILTQLQRDVSLLSAAEKHMRYTFVKFMLVMLGGSSAKYKTLAESPVVGHMLESTSFKEMQHFCQQSAAHRLQRYDHGPLVNLFKYGSIWPPARNMSNMHVKNWLLVTGEHDNLATPESSKLLMDTIQPPPERQVLVKQASHLDLIASIDNDLTVNFPILEFLDKHQLPPRDNPSSINREANELYDRKLRPYVLEESNPRVERPEH